MVLVGRFYYHERLDPLQWAAVACAALGVAHEVGDARVRVADARRRARLSAVFRAAPADQRRFARRVRGRDRAAARSRSRWSRRARRRWPTIRCWAALLPGLGVLSTLALASYLKASRMLPMALFGILGYVGVLLVAVSLLLLGETLSIAARDVRADLGRRRAHRVAQRDADAAPARARINGDREAAAHAACRVAHRKTPAPQRSDPSMLTANWHRADASLATLPALRDKARACNRTEDSVALCYLGSPRIGH